MSSSPREKKGGMIDLPALQFDKAKHKRRSTVLN